MGWLLAKEGGNESVATCDHGIEIRDECPKCVALRAEEQRVWEKQYAVEKKARIEEVFGSAVPLSEATQVSEVEDYLDYESGTMEWVLRDEFVRRTDDRAVFANGKVWTYVDGNSLNWR